VYKPNDVYNLNGACKPNGVYTPTGIGRPDHLIWMVSIKAFWMVSKMILRASTGPRLDHYLLFFTFQSVKIPQLIMATQPRPKTEFPCPDVSASLAAREKDVNDSRQPDSLEV
jgi:hypothetical protein